MPAPTVLEIELAGLKGWPALDVERDGSLILRAAGGYTRRCNSMQIIDIEDDGDLDARLVRAMRWYRDRALPPVFRVTPLASPAVREQLASWPDEGHSHVVAMQIVSAADEPDGNVEFLPPASPAWLDAQQLLQEYSEDTRERLRHIVERIMTPARGVLLRDASGEPVASALMVVADGFVITGNVITAVWARGKGNAQRMMRAGLGWARRAGARRAALNVSADNEAALRLYAGLGYTHQYDYHYRVLPK